MGILTSTPTKKTFWPKSWPKVRPPGGKTYREIHSRLKKLNLATVCQEALCPNINECWSSGTATFMLMGDTCTRACRFCAVKTGNPQGKLDPLEAIKLGQALAAMKLDYVVLTSVDRDDLPDGGSSHFAQCIKTIKGNVPTILVEALTPDFNGTPAAVKKIICAGVDVYAHNVETVERLTPKVRDRRSSYRQSLRVLQLAKSLNQIYSKSSIMLGLGEREKEVRTTLQDLRDSGVDGVTLGQYLAPTGQHKKYLPVEEYLSKKRFADYGQMAQEMGFLFVASGPLVRSSYRASELFFKRRIQSVH